MSFGDVAREHIASEYRRLSSDIEKVLSGELKELVFAESTEYELVLTRRMKESLIKRCPHDHHSIPCKFPEYEDMHDCSTNECICIDKTLPKMQC